MSNRRHLDLTDDRTRVQDPASRYEAYVSHFGALKTGTTIPVIKGNFPGSSLNTDVWTETSSNSASITVADGMAQLISGTNSAGSTRIISAKSGRFEAGQVTVFQSGVRAGVAQANNTKIWGLMDSSRDEGLYFKMNGTTFQVVARKGGTETAVSIGNFNGGDQAWTPGDSNSTYRIEYSAGRASFYRAAAGKKILIHEMVDTAEPLVSDLDLNLYYENTNSGNTTSTSMYIRGASISIWGDTRRFNESGSQHVVNEAVEMALGNIEKREVETKFGRNSDVDTGTAEDIWDGGGDYTGQPESYTPETVEVFSASANDTSEGTGARTIRITGLKTSSSTKYETEDLTMNGVSAVTSTNSWWRVNRAQVLTAGSGGENAGNITIRPTTSTSNVFAVLPAGFNQTTIAAYTVPAECTAVIRRIRAAIVRANGSAGSATISLRSRPTGGVYNALRVFEVQTGPGTGYTEVGGTVLTAGTDIKFRVDTVSDNNNVVEAAVEMVIRKD